MLKSFSSKIYFCFKRTYRSFTKAVALAVITLSAFSFICALVIGNRSRIRHSRWPETADRNQLFFETGHLSATSRNTDTIGSKWWWNFDTRPFKPAKPTGSNRSRELIPLIVFRNTLFGPRLPARNPPQSFNASYLKCSLPYLQHGLDCQFTFDTENLRHADAVVTQMFRNTDLQHPKHGRHPDQIWVFLNWESPTKNRSGYPTLFANTRLEPEKDRYTEKSRMAVAMTSSCRVASGREEYLDELVKAGISIDQLGKCEGKELKRQKAPEVCRRTGVYSTSTECEAFLSSTYKFYLAFENSLCRDYVTEKFFRAASLDLIPVVLNGANMSLLAPKGSYIDTKDFASPRELATYLKKVAGDKDLYNSFFWWKPYYDVELTFEGLNFYKNICHFCQRLHDHKTHPQNYFYADILHWFYDQANCEIEKAQWS